MSIHEKALQASQNFRNAEVELINIIGRIDFERAYRDKGFTSSFDYCVKFLKLSESNSYNFISIARKSRQVPELKVAIESDMLTVSKAKKIVSVITNENKDHWLDLAQKLPKAQLEREVAKINPTAVIPEKVKYLSENRLKLELGLSEEIIADLRRIQEILSQKAKRHINLEEAVGEIAKDYLKREDPLQRAERAINRARQRKGADDEVDAGLEGAGLAALKPNELVPGPVAFTASNPMYPLFRRVPVRAILNHQVNLRDGGRCTFIGQDGERCTERKWLQKHHVLPVGLGGQNDLENLTTLCFAHHQIVHDRLDKASGTWRSAIEIDQRI